MRLDTILANIKAADTASEKTASAHEASGVVPRDALLAALNETSTTAKVASATRSPVDDLMKIATDVASTEQEMAIKEAQLLGRAFADAVVSRVGEWQGAAANLPTAKVASYQVEGFDKFASENPDLVKQAAELGYTQTRAALEKFAADEYNRGYNDTLVEVQKLAAAEFAKASVLTGNILTHLAG